MTRHDESVACHLDFSLSGPPDAHGNAKTAFPRILLGLILGLLFMTGEPLSAATITVDSTLDAVFDDGNCTLREAIISANTDALVDACVKGNGSDEIILPAGTYTLTIPGTNETASADGDLNIFSNVTISGADASTTIIDGNGTVTGERAIDIGLIGNSNISVAINDVTIRNGATTTTGGGILNRGNTTFTNVVISGNTAAQSGGGIYNSLGNMTLTNATVSGNTAATSGGGLYNISGLTILNSTISENTATGGLGGAIAGLGNSLTVTDSTIKDNTAAIGGGGVHSGAGTTKITGCTVSGNSVSNGSGGGIFGDGGNDFTVAASTVSGNSAQAGGGVYIARGFLKITTSTISDNAALGDGGGITNKGSLIVDMTAVNGNTADGQGGGISSISSVNVTNSTISGNTAQSHGGGIANTNGIVTMNNATITDNTADVNSDDTGDGGGVYTNIALSNISNTLIAKNTDASNGAEAPDCSGDINSLGNNLLGNNTGCNFSTNTGDIVGTPDNPVDPLLGPLGGNGGSNPTHELLDQSPAIDAGNDASCETLDQRGVNRPADGNNDGISICDIGSYELKVEPNIIFFDPVAPADDLTIPFDKRVIFTSPTLDLTITNNGRLDLKIKAIGNTAFLEPPFSMNEDCTAAPITPAGSCTITVQFSPATEGQFTDSFDIISNDPDQSTVKVNVSGEGVLSLNNTPPAAPELLSPDNGATGQDPDNVNFSWNRAKDPDNDQLTYSILLCSDPSLFLCPDPVPLQGLAASDFNQSVLYAGLGTSGILFGLIGFTGARSQRRLRVCILILAALSTSPLLISCDTGLKEIDVNAAISSAPLSVSFGSFDPNTTYYWRIDVNDNKGGLASSAVRNFKTGDAAPAPSP